MTRRRITKTSSVPINGLPRGNWLPWLLAIFLGIGWLSSSHPEWIPWQTWAQRVGLAATPRQKMLRQWESTGFDTTSLGKRWLKASEEALVALDRTPSKLPISQTLYFSFEPQAYLFPIRIERGRKLVLKIEENLSGGASLVELYRGSDFTNLEEAKPYGRDSLRLLLEEDSDFLLRIEVPPLSIGSVAIRVSSDPSLSVFPVEGARQRDIGSLWGDPRDGGARKHEGIDIFSKKGTPLLASASGRVRRVKEGGLGGKTVWLDIDEPKASLYYAHLDKQLVYEGQRVNAGDQIGLVGNTGNARTTPPHLHFGIYRQGKAVDPLPFVNSGQKPAYPSPISRVGDQARVSSKSTSYSDAFAKRASGSLSAKQHVRVLRANGSRLLVELNDNAQRWIDESNLEALNTNKVIELKEAAELVEFWNGVHYRVGFLKKGEEVRSLAEGAAGRTFIQTRKGKRGWVMKM